ncbi:MAG: Glycine cleavage system H protein [Alphaproteobacteria bacterium MarineAlpha3_Bin5]|nr:glycine cleavage system protein H [Magnetovibrio sp.]PPR76559.1 MAG: Glycine cleavage system H protein [Alphaproteobacteria bacterium MarineAlpha3_Bin5]
MSLSYTKDHEWVSISQSIATIGISDFAQEQLGEVVFVELPDLERNVTKGESVAVVESVKAASEVYSPVDGIITECNESLIEEPKRLNLDPIGNGWILKIALSNPEGLSGLMDETRYKEYIQGIV